MAISIGAVFLTLMLMQSTKYGDQEDQTKFNYWTYFCIFIYSIIVTVTNAFVSSIAEYIVNRLNIGDDGQYE